MRRTMILAVLALVAGQVSVQAQPVLVFDSVTAQTAAGGVFSTSSTPNTFMGDGYNLTSGTTDITGFDVYPVNASGTTFNALKIDITSGDR